MEKILNINVVVDTEQKENFFNSLDEFARTGGIGKYEVITEEDY